MVISPSIHSSLLLIAITDECALSNEEHRDFLPKKSKCICRSLNGKRHLTSSTLLTRWSASISKLSYHVGVAKLLKKTGL